jgi:conjugative transfer region lipoprotein (TIGR03751 family)
MAKRLINSVGVIALCIASLSGCASKLEDVTNPNAPTMKDVYEDYTGSNKSEIAERQAVLMQRPALEVVDQQLGLPPYPERLDHLYPRLPNPDLFMYVRPHAVGITGAPVPAYITRFSMYERQPYALPGETLDAAKIVSDFKVKKIEERKAAAEKADTKKNDRELFNE